MYSRLGSGKALELQVLIFASPCSSRTERTRWSLRSSNHIFQACTGMIRQAILIRCKPWASSKIHRLYPKISSCYPGILNVRATPSSKDWSFNTIKSANTILRLTLLLVNPIYILNSNVSKLVRHNRSHVPYVIQWVFVSKGCEFTEIAHACCRKMSSAEQDGWGMQAAERTISIAKKLDTWAEAFRKKYWGY